MAVTACSDDEELAKREAKKVKKQKKKDRKEKKKADKKRSEELTEAGDSDGNSAAHVEYSSLNADIQSQAKNSMTKKATARKIMEEQHLSPPAFEASSVTSSSSRHPFEVDEADHCETPLRAYEDILPLLDQIAKAVGKTDRHQLVIYDPYYCDGGIKRKLQHLGIPAKNVRNENRDFYKDIANQTVPPHDVVITNPPYSGTHMEQLFDFLSRNTQQKGPEKKTLTPFLLLLPHYVYTKPYFCDYFQSDARGVVSPQQGRKNITALFYLVPKFNYRYAYEPPSWVNHDTGSTALKRGKTQTAPFPSFWYCHVPSLQQQSSQNESDWLTRTFGRSGHYISTGQTISSNPSSHRLHYASCTSHLPREFKGEFDVTNKRPNARSRKRAAKKRHQQPQELTTQQPQQQKWQQQQQGSGNPPKRKKKRY